MSDRLLVKNLLEVNNLHTSFFVEEGEAKAVDGISFSVPESESVGLVGESGSGKTMTALSILGLVARPGRIVSGEILFESRKGRVDLTKIKEEELRQIRGGEISMIFQEPFTALNPVFTVEYQIQESVGLHLGLSGKQAKQKVLEVLSDVGIKDAARIAGSYPHELSGGLRQRAMIAMALVSSPKLLIADEPTTALDVTVQTQILDLLAEIKERMKLSLIMVSHDLGVISRVCDTVNIMYAGRLVEKASKKDLFKNPLHPYTEGLLGSVPSIEKIEKRLRSIPGSVPSPLSLPLGCKFHPRCTKVMDICKREEPADRIIGNRCIRCWLYNK